MCLHTRGGCLKGGCHRLFPRAGSISCLLWLLLWQLNSSWWAETGAPRVSTHHDRDDPFQPFNPKMHVDPNREPLPGEKCSISQAWFKQPHPSHCFAASQPPVLQPRGPWGLQRAIWCMWDCSGKEAWGTQMQQRRGHLPLDRGSCPCPRRLPCKNAVMSRDREWWSSTATLCCTLWKGSGRRDGCRELASKVLGATSVMLWVQFYRGEKGNAQGLSSNHI